MPTKKKRMDTTQISVNQYHWHVFLNSNSFGKQENETERRLQHKLESANINYTLHISQSKEEDINTIQKLCKNGNRHFVVVGGDGSLNFFINAVMKSGIDSHELYIALFPLGTGNDWARSHHLKSDFNVLEDFLYGHFVNHDIGVVDITSSDNSDRKYFVNIAGFGFDAQIIKNTKENEYKNRSQMYLLSLLKTLVTYKSQQVCIHIDNQTIDKKIYTIAVGLNKFNGNGMKQCPGAICDDGLFEVVIIDDVSPMQVVKNVKNLFSGTHLQKMKHLVSVFNTNKLVIESKKEFYGEVEGEMLPQGKYSIDLLPKAIHLLTSFDFEDDK